MNKNYNIALAIELFFEKVLLDPAYNFSTDSIKKYENFKQIVTIII
jgi:hypothetical protein